MSKFVKTETKTTILETINYYGLDYSYISIVPLTHTAGVDIVIGAAYEDKWDSGFSKSGVKELISILQEVHDAM